MTGVGAALGDAVFGAVAAFGLASSRSSSPATKPGCAASAAWCWSAWAGRRCAIACAPVGDPVSDDREHRVATHFHFASSSFFITVFNPLTVMAFGAAFAGRDLAGVGAQPAGRRPPGRRRVLRRARPGGRSCAPPRWRCAHHFTGKGILWLNRISGAVILALRAGGADLAAAAALESDLAGCSSSVQTMITAQMPPMPSSQASRFGHELLDEEERPKAATAPNTASPSAAPIPVCPATAPTRSSGGCTAPRPGRPVWRSGSR